MLIVRRMAAFVALLTMGSAPALAENPVALQREYKATKGLFVLAAPANMTLAEVHERLLKLMTDTGSEVQEDAQNEITARTTFATFVDPMLALVPGGVLDINYQRAAYNATGMPVFQLRRITLAQEGSQPVRVQFCSRVKQYTPRSNGPPDVAVVTKCKLDFREWNALRGATAQLFD